VIISRVAVLGLLMFAAPPAYAKCSGKQSVPWKGFTLEALADGPDCDRAVVLFVMRNKKGDIAYTMSGEAAHNASFQPDQTKNGKDIAIALKAWISAENGRRTMADLPDWKKGDSNPDTTPPAEFPFMIGDELDRDRYLAMRRAKSPMFCLTQGMESLRCLAVGNDGSVVDIGVQRFPG
jgi:hypothetical protein